MQTIENMSVENPELVELCLQGNRNAFGQIVARYQSLICALTYSICGDIGRSEDLAQETFITAWRHLADLKEAANLRNWLCGIARNLSNNSLRKDQRTPTAGAEPISLESDSLTATPLAQAISKEEEKLIWSALESMPPHYREPMILFYRESQSTRAVATMLGLSDEAVRQRLSRGRALLSERIAKTVEITLLKSAPSASFTMAVMGGLPAFPTPAKAGAMASAAWKSGALVKLAPALGWFGSSFLGMLGSMFYGSKAAIEDSTSSRERQFRTRVAWMRIVALVISCTIGALLMDRLGEMEGILIGMFGGCVFEILVPVRWRQIQIKEGTWVPPETEETKGTWLTEFRTAGSKAEFYWAVARLLFLASMAPVAIYSAIKGYWYLPVFFIYLAALWFFGKSKGLQRKERYDARFGVLAKRVWNEAFGFIFAYNLNRIPFAAPVVKISTHWVLFNFCIILAHLALIGVLYLEYRRHPQE